MSDPEPVIDFTQMEFPSDRLTVKELRKAIPRSFDLPAREGYSRMNRQGFFNRESLENCLGGLINAEREIAFLAFYAALGKTPGSDLVGPRWDAVEALINEYTVVGLASGEHHGQELIRRIEDQAIAQAQRYLGHTPDR